MGRLMRRALLLAGAAASLAAAGCAWKGPKDAGPQGWDAAMQSDWYGATQGSRFMPWAWAKALEKPGSTEKLFTDANFAQYRFLLRPGQPLPVGMAIDAGPDDNLTVTKLRWFAGQKATEQWVGFNCSACHTAEVSFNGKAVRVDGGPALLDFQSFVDDASAALAATRADPAKFDRFAAAVLKEPGDTPANRAALAQAVGALAAWNARISTANATDLKPGFARVDAFGHIYNKVALMAGPDTPAPMPSDAPVSYPFLWNVNQADRVQWNGIAENKFIKVGAAEYDYGALGRNAGEVIGVYGDVKVVPNPATLAGYKSSLQVRSLSDLERILATLKPPAWPADLMGKPDPALVAAGDKLFEAQCQGCHTHLDRDDLKTPFKIKMSLLRANVPGNIPPGTDPWMACNAYTYTARTGYMATLPKGFIGKDPPLGPEAPVANMLSTMVIATLVGDKWEAIKSAGVTFIGVPPAPKVIQPEAVPVSPKDLALQRCFTEASDILGYKARPLTGIWATAPYLHNGSVPTLYDLLLPPAQRPASFNLGTREYDPVKVGYQTAPSAANSFRFDTSLAGNGNGGHDYGNAKLTEADRRALVEYMKTL